MNQREHFRVSPTRSAKTLLRLKPVLLLVLALLVAPLLATAQVAKQTRPLNDDTYIETVEDCMAKAESAYAAGRFSEAYGFYYWAALRDHPLAQEMVGIMLLLGHETFGAQIAANRNEAAFWLKQAAANGRGTSRKLSAALAFKPPGPANSRRTRLN